MSSNLILIPACITEMILYYCLNLPKVYKKNLIYLIHTVKTGVSLSTQVKLKFLFSIRQADLLSIVLGMEMKILIVNGLNMSQISLPYNKIGLIV
jgi:hypothetical protein